MPLLLRGVDKRRWDWPGPAFSWLLTDEYPAAPFGDLRTDARCDLSTWQIADDRANLLRVISALAAGRINTEKLDYVLIDERLLADLSISIKATPGKSADSDANGKWHRDVIELTGDKLVRLVQLLRSRDEIDRVSEPRIITLLREGLRVGQLDRARVDERLLRSLGD